MIQGSSIGHGLHVRASLLEAFRVTAASMYPTVALDDHILGNKTAYRRADPQRGDIILFHPPTGDWRSACIKRIVAIGGDTVELRPTRLQEYPAFSDRRDGLPSEHESCFRLSVRMRMTDLISWENGACDVHGWSC
jgi:signal peptidase I